MNQFKYNTQSRQREKTAHPVLMICQKLKKLAETPNLVMLDSKLDSQKLNTRIKTLLFSADQFLFEFYKKHPQTKKTSLFKQQLQEQKKVSFFYGHLSKKQILKLIHAARQHRGNFAKNFLSLLEKRLDVVLFRSGFVSTIHQAQQIISHKKIMVNNQVITISSYSVVPGDIISILPSYSRHLAINRITQLKTQYTQGNNVSIVFPENVSHLKKVAVDKEIWQNTAQKFIEMLLEKIGIQKKKSFSLSSQAIIKDTNNFELSRTYRTQFIQLLSQLPLMETSHRLLVLSLKKYLYTQASREKVLTGLRLHGAKPLHLEISYKVFKIIFLYSPQRVYFPFLVDIDTLKKM
jgi:ribosomal protein S4